MIRLERKLQYDINREATKKSALLSGKIKKYKYLAGEDVLPSDHKRVIEQAKFTYFLLQKGFRNTNKNDSRARKKQIDAITDQNEKLGALANRYSYKKIVKELVKERLDKMK